MIQQEGDTDLVTKGDVENALAKEDMQCVISLI